MRILMANWLYYPEYSGAALQARSLARELGYLGAKIEVLTGTATPDLVGENRVDGLRIHRFLTAPDPANTIAASLTILGFFLKNRKKFDVVHTHGFMPQVNAAAKLAGLPIIQKITCEYVDDPAAVKARARGSLLMKLYCMADLVVAPSPRLYQAAKPELPEKIRIKKIPNGVDTDLFAPVPGQLRQAYRDELQIKSDEVVLLTVGTLSFNKGADLLMQALPSLLRKIQKKIKVILLGPQSRQLYFGDQRTDVQEFTRMLRQQVQEKGLATIVRFEGRRENLAYYMRAADILVHPARVEGQPNAILEGLAAGLPILANHIPGITDDLVDNGFNGFVVDCSKPALFSGRLATLIEDDGLRHEMGQRARSTALAKYEIHNIAMQYLKFYRHLLSSGRKNDFYHLPSRREPAGHLVTTPVCYPASAS